MNAIGEPPDKPARKPRRRDRILAVVGGAAVVIAVWLTGIPQERLGDWGLEHFLGTGVQCEYGSTFGALHIDSLLLFATIEEQGPPVIQIRDLTIDYELFAKNGRKIREVVIGELTVRLDALDIANPNFAFLIPLLTNDDSDPLPPSVIPERVRIENIAVALAVKPSGAIDGQPFEALGMNIAGLKALVELDGNHVTRAALTGEDVTTRTWVGKVANGMQHDQGRVQVAFHGDATTSRFDNLHVDLPGLLELEGIGSTEQAELATLKVSGEGFQSDAMPFAFDQIDASGIMFDSNADPSLTLPCAITGLRVGATEQPLYDGALQITANRVADNNIEIVIGLNEGQRIDVLLAPDQGNVIAAVETWTPEMLEAAVPAAYRSRLAELPEFNAFNLTLAASAPNIRAWFDDASLQPLPFDFSMFGDATLPREANDGGLRIEAAGTGVWSGEALDSASAKGGIVIAGERAEFAVARAADRTLESTLNFDDVKIGRWLKLAFGDIPVGSDSGILNGSVAYDGVTGNGELTLSKGNERAIVSASITGASNTPNDPLAVVATVESGGKANLNYESANKAWSGAVDFEAFDIGRLARLVGYESDIAGTATGRARVARTLDTADGEVTARLDGIQSDDWSLNPDAPIELAASFTSDADFQHVQGRATHVALGGETLASVDRWEWTQEPWRLSAKAEANLDLAKHGKAIGVEGWSGQAQATVSIVHEQDRWKAPAHVVWTDPRIPGLNDFYAGPITFDGDLARSPNATATTLTNGRVAWGEHTQVSLPRASVETSPFGVIGEVNIDSDLTVLVALGVLQYVDGTMNAQGEVRLIDGNPQFELTVDGTVAGLEMPDSLAVGSAAHVAGQITYDGEYGGSGTFSAGSAFSGGALLTDIAGGYAFTGDRLTLSDVAGQLYGGNVLGRGQVELLTGTYNGEFNADITRLDLDRFTKEFEPGEFRLTGISNGEAYVRWSTVGLSGARFLLTSTEGFSLDRETVETMLTTSALPDQWGMRWIRKRINKKMIGDDPQRPFDSARVDLNLYQAEGEQDRLMGPITLKSETLDFNIDWTIDLDAIYAAMESELADVENISTGAVQSENQ